MVGRHGIESATGARSATEGCDRRRRPIPLALALLASFVITTQAAAQAVSEGARRSGWNSKTNTPPIVRQADGWEVFLTLYLWASGLEGEVGSRGRSAEADLGFSDIVQDLDGALMLPIE